MKAVPINSRFLLARHKAAIDVYNEAAKMCASDWVRRDYYIMYPSNMEELNLRTNVTQPNYFYNHINISDIFTCILRSVDSLHYNDATCVMICPLLTDCLFDTLHIAKCLHFTVWNSPCGRVP